VLQQNTEPQTAQIPSGRPGTMTASEIAVRGSGIELTGFLYRPAAPGPHPAMLQLHGCAGFRNTAGVPNASYRFWAEHWVSLGFVVLILDSFTARGEKEICTQKVRKIRVNVERVEDAYTGLGYLAGLPDVDSSRILVQGWSNGGSTVLNAVSANGSAKVNGGPRFRAAVAFYPGCFQLLRKHWISTVPLLIQSGAADDWTPAQDCEQIVEQARTSGAPVHIDVYPDAYHSFDRLQQPFKFLSDVGPGLKGAHVGTNIEARENSLRRTTDWVLEHLQ
jgi:dienelactone hydrolase